MDVIWIVIGMLVSICDTVTVFAENSLSGYLVDTVTLGSGDTELLDINVQRLNYFAKLLVCCYVVQCSTTFLVEYIYGICGKFRYGVDEKQTGW